MIFMFEIDYKQFVKSIGILMYLLAVKVGS